MLPDLVLELLSLLDEQFDLFGEPSLDYLHLVVLLLETLGVVLQQAESVNDARGDARTQVGVRVVCELNLVDVRVYIAFESVRDRFRHNALLVEALIVGDGPGRLIEGNRGEAEALLLSAVKHVLVQPFLLLLDQSFLEG